MRWCAIWRRISVGNRSIFICFETGGQRRLVAYRRRAGGQHAITRPSSRVTVNQSRELLKTGIGMQWSVEKVGRASCFERSSVRDEYETIQAPATFRAAGLTRCAPVPSCQWMQRRLTTMQG
jgi:hypothetical protein